MDEEAQKSRTTFKPSPGTAIPPLPVLIRGVRMTAEGFLEFFSPDPAGDDPQRPLGPGIGRVMPPEELYLRRLMDLDLADASAILEFTRRFGRMEKERWELLPAWLVNDRQGRGDPPEIDRITDSSLATSVVAWTQKAFRTSRCFDFTRASCETQFGFGRAPP